MSYDKEVMTVETTANREYNWTACRQCVTYSGDCYECVEYRMLADSNCEQCELNTFAYLEVSAGEFTFRECRACSDDRRACTRCGDYCDYGLCEAWCVCCDGEKKDCPFYLAAYEERDQEPYCTFCQTGGCIGNCDTAQRLLRMCSSRSVEEIQRDLAQPCCEPGEEDCLACRAFDEEPYCGACQTGGCIGDCETAAHVSRLRFNIESLSLVCSSRAEPLLEGDVGRWEHLTTQQERIEKLEELEVELISAGWDLGVSRSHTNSLRRDVESLSRVCGFGAEPFLRGDAHRWKHLTTQQERTEKLEEMRAELQAAKHPDPETQPPPLSDEEIQRRLAPYSAAALA